VASVSPAGSGAAAGGGIKASPAGSAPAMEKRCRMRPFFCGPATYSLLAFQSRWCGVGIQRKSVRLEECCTAKADGHANGGGGDVCSVARGVVRTGVVDSREGSAGAVQSRRRRLCAKDARETRRASLHTCACHLGAQLEVGTQGCVTHGYSDVP
jgi:hypothetical protein